MESADFPQFSREPIRPEMELPPTEKPLWRPTWDCYCCSDTGFVNQNLVKLVIKDYNHHKDKLVVCQRNDCGKGEKYILDVNYDQRFDSGLCARLDAFYRKDWNSTVKAQSELIQYAVKSIAGGMSLRRRDRTYLEQQLAEAKHQKVIAEEDTSDSDQENELF